MGMDDSSKALAPGLPASGETVEAVERLKAELERQTALREATDRAAARARDDREDAFERLLLRCSALEEEAGKWADVGLRSAGDLQTIERQHAEALARRSDELSRAFEARLEGIARDNRAEVESLDRQIAELRGELTARIAEGNSLSAERDASIADRDRHLAAAEAREGESLLRLAEAEERFQAEVSDLSASIALRSEEARDARAEVEALKQRLTSVQAPKAWKTGGPLRGAGRFARRVGGILARLTGRGRQLP